MTQQTEQYGIFEISFRGKQTDDPFSPSCAEAIFQSADECKKVCAFYDGDDTYKVRFMPSQCGTYTYRISGSCLDGELTGTFTVTPAKEGNHGMVRATADCHFVYSDGTPCHPIGTTCYAWLHQPLSMREQTVKTLAGAPFNKIRMCVFPKDYVYNKTDPELFPFARKDGSEPYCWDYTRFCPEYFQNIDHYLGELLKLGIEADLILFHPYDKWGFSKMPHTVNERYLSYLIARCGAFRNVWWSLANEYDFMKEKSEADWDFYGEYLAKNDCYKHLIGVHNGVTPYHPDRPWLTHVSIQKQDVCKLSNVVKEHLEKYHKPVILDEVGYEGTIDYLWGNLSPQTLLYRCYEAVMGGGYVTHGETYYSDEEKIWWSHGGELHGESAPRLAFLKDLLADVPGSGLRPLAMEWDDTAVCAQDDEGYMLFYYGIYRPRYRTFNRLDADCDYQVEIIDTWNMTITSAGVLHGQFRLELPAREWMMVRIKKLRG